LLSGLGAEHSALSNKELALFDKNTIKNFYLNLPLYEVVEKFQKMELKFIDADSIIPFSAKLRDYQGAVDKEGSIWLVKKIIPGKEYRISMSELAYFIDLYLGTLSAPTIFTKINKQPYLATKLVHSANQLGGYNYLEKPFLEVLANDLINRWLFYDEDRNPNNYLVFEDSFKKKIVVAIDYDHIDLASSKLKIEAIPEKFGWRRQGKNRFLSLLNPEHFEQMNYSVFEARLKKIKKLNYTFVYQLALSLFSKQVAQKNEKQKKAGVVKNEKLAHKIATILTARSKYIYEYFVKIFPEK